VVKIDQDTNIRLLDNLAKSSGTKPKSDVNRTSETQKTTSVVDKVELSTSKEEVNRLKEKIKAIPEVDSEKVAQMQQALKTDTYNPKGELVARKILQSQLLDEIF
jgi:flagellar biosynthesis anti-sigma factor FlgM